MRIREVEMQYEGKRLVFATRTCCGPDGRGPCLSEQEGLQCGVAWHAIMTPPEEARERGRKLRIYRLALGVSLRDAAAALGLSPVEYSSLERGRAEPESWDEVHRILRAGASHE